MFLLKKIVGQLFLPMTLCLLVLWIGLILVWMRKKENLGRILASIGLLFLTLLSYNAVASHLSQPLECRYPPVRLSEAAGARWIVVLGGGTNVSEASPAISQLSKESLFRLAEGIRIHRQIQGSRLLLSGGAVFESVPEADMMARAAKELGVQGKDMVLDSASRDTENQVRNILGVIGKDKFVVVTSTSHMPRAMAMFKKKQVNPIAAPAGVCVVKQSPLQPSDFYPQADALRRSETAIYEYLGILWAKLRGII